MNIKNITLYALVLVLLTFMLAACGSNTSGGKGSVTVSLTFPPQSAAMTGVPTALISASTASFDIRVYDGNTAGATLLGYARITAPAGGGTVSATLDLVPYTGPAWVTVIGTNQSGNGNSYMMNFINIQPQNSPLALTVVEMGQGFVAPANTTLLGPDGVSYLVNNFFLDTTSVAGFVGDYILGANVTYGAAAPVTANIISFYNPDTTNVFNTAPWIVNGTASFNLDVASGAGTVKTQASTVWNRYHITVNFNNGPGGTPTNTPTITNQFQGTLTFDPVTLAVIPYTASASVPAASGTIIMTLANASWANNIAPPHASQSVILMYGQPQQQTGLRSKLF